MNATTANYPAILAFIAVVSALGSAAGVYVTIKICLARLEMWREIADVRISKLENDTAVLKDDSKTFDMEIDRLYEEEGLHRVRRQVARG